jgi:hypothetical protein
MIKLPWNLTGSIFKKFKNIELIKGDVRNEADVRKPIVSKDFCNKRIVDKAWAIRKEAQAYPISYEGDIPFYRRFLDCLITNSFPSMWP